MTRNPHIVCVEWTEPVSVRWLLRDMSILDSPYWRSREDWASVVYLIEDEAGSPLYVGASRLGARYRLMNHTSGPMTQVRYVVLACDRGEIHLTCRWAHVDPANLFKLEHQVIAALRPRYNRLGNHGLRNAPPLPDRRAA